MRPLWRGSGELRRWPFATPPPAPSTRHRGILACNASTSSALGTQIATTARGGASTILPMTRLGSALIVLLALSACTATVSDVESPDDTAGSSGGSSGGSTTGGNGALCSPCTVDADCGEPGVGLCHLGFCAT